MIVIYDKRKQRVPIKAWVNRKEDIEEGALKQAKNLANLPFIHKHVALMPDVHQGYGMPIGGIIATEGVIIPNAVGVDIGCGMGAIKTNWANLDSNTLKHIRNGISKKIPVGFNHNKTAQDEWLIEGEKHDLTNTIIEQEYKSSLYQLGTLGGGNHFIEIQKGSDGYIWIMVHSGSRNLGYKVAKHYNKIAKKLNKKWFSSVPIKNDLAFLPMETDEAKKYMKEMRYCVDFAYANRKLMLNKIKFIVTEIISKHYNRTTVFDRVINIAHNYAARENHYGKNVIVHRKGATLARKDTTGIIPGSQGTNSYIVKGLGNPESFDSCSHGAGRVMGRREAKRKLDFKTETKKLDSQNILHNLTIKGLDEAPGAYKDINIVMNNQRDLVKKVVELSPLTVIKG